jgi:hypothetical protein
MGAYLHKLCQLVRMQFVDCIRGKSLSVSRTSHDMSFVTAEEEEEDHEIMS